jgi:hypothetical protein
MLHKKPFWFGFIPGLLLLIETIAFLTTYFPARTEGEGFLVLFGLIGAFAVMTAMMFMLLPFKTTRPAAYGLATPLVLAYVFAAIVNMRSAIVAPNYTDAAVLLSIGLVVLLPTVATALLSRRRRRSNDDGLALTVRLK